MDALSEILKAIHLQGAVFLDVRPARGLVVPDAVAATDRRAAHARGEHIISVSPDHVGRLPCGRWGSELVAVEAGDLIVFPHGDRHILASASAVDREPTEIAADMLRGLLRPGEERPCATVVPMFEHRSSVATWPAIAG
jgi:hypothetical protein